MLILNIKTCKKKKAAKNIYNFIIQNQQLFISFPSFFYFFYAIILYSGIISPFERSKKEFSEITAYLE